MDRFPLALRALAAVGLVALVGVGGYFVLLAPQLSEVKSLRAQLAQRVDAGRVWQPVPSVSPITEVERQLWDELEKRLRERYSREPELPKAVSMIGNFARSSGMVLVSLELHARDPGPATSPPSTAPLPPELVVNPSTIKLVAHHRYRDLVEFLERVHRAPVYLAVQSLEVRRVENRLSTEASFASLRWGN